MLCTNCGKDVPFGGKVCPYCGVDKSHDQTSQANAQVAGCAVAVIVLVITYAISQNGVIAFMVALGAMVAAQVAVLGSAKTPTQRIAPTIQRTTETSTDDTKKCPFCAETIKSEAVKCRFCGSDLNK